MSILLHPDFISLPELKRGISRSELRADMDSELTDICNGVWRAAESFMRRQLATATYTHDGTTLPLLPSEFARQLYLENPPITNLASLRQTPTAAAMTRGYNQHFTLDENTGKIELVLGLSFIESQEIVEVTYTGGFLEKGNSALTAANAHRFGWEDAGADIKRSIIVQTADYYQRKARGRERVTSFTTDGGTFTVSEDTLLSDVKDTWRDHRLAIIC